MSTVAATSVVEIAKGPNDENVKCFQVVIPVAGSGDTITIALPLNADGVSSDFIAKSFALTALRVEQYTDVAAGSRVHTNIAITSYTYSEVTGVISVVIGAAITTIGRAYVTVAGTN